MAVYVYVEKDKRKQSWQKSKWRDKSVEGTIFSNFSRGLQCLKIKSWDS